MCHELYTYVDRTLIGLTGIDAILLLPSWWHFLVSLRGDSLTYVVYNIDVLTLEKHLDAMLLWGLPVKVSANGSVAFVRACLPTDLCAAQLSETHVKATRKLEEHDNISANNRHWSKIWWWELLTNWQSCAEGTNQAMGYTNLLNESIFFFLSKTLIFYCLIVECIECKSLLLVTC